MKKLTKQQRIAWYNFILEKLLTRHGSAPYICQIVAEKKRISWGLYDFDDLCKEFKELSLFKCKSGSLGFHADEDENIEKFALRELIMIFCIEIAQE